MSTSSCRLPHGWAEVAFAECIDIPKGPFVKLPQKRYLDKGSYPIVDQGASLIAGFTDNENELFKGELPVIIFGDHTRIFKYIDFGFAIGADGTKILKPKRGLNSKYLFYYLKSIELPSRGYSRHYRYLREKTLRLAPRNQQDRIVKRIELLLDPLNRAKHELAGIPPVLKRLRQSVLAKAFTGELTREWRDQQKNLEPTSTLLERIRIERKKQISKKYREPELMDTSSLSKLPEGWEWTRLEQIVQILDSMRVPVNSRDRKERKGNVPYYGANGQVGWIDDYIFDEPLVLLAEDGGFFDTWEKPNAYPIRGKSWVNNHAHVLRPSEGVEIEIILHALNNTWLMPYVQGTTRYKLNQSSMRRILVPLPPRHEQRHITERIAKSFARIDTIQKSIQTAQVRCENLEQSILTKAFRGEFVEQDPDDEPVKILLGRIRSKEKLG